jgi:hypothetical protein
VWEQQEQIRLETASISASKNLFVTAAEAAVSFRRIDFKQLQTGGCISQPMCCCEMRVAEKARESSLHSGQE